MTKLTHRSFFYMFISILYMFRATSCPSSGEPIVSIQHLVCHCVSDRLACRSGRKVGKIGHPRRSGECYTVHYSGSWLSHCSLCTRRHAICDSVLLLIYFVYSPCRAEWPRLLPGQLFFNGKRKTADRTRRYMSCDSLYLRSTQRHTLYTVSCVSPQLRGIQRHNSFTIFSWPILNNRKRSKEQNDLKVDEGIIIGVIIKKLDVD
jgi:hypothetical protein